MFALLLFQLGSGRKLVDHVEGVLVDEMGHSHSNHRQFGITTRQHSLEKDSCPHLADLVTENVDVLQILGIRNDPTT